LKPGIRIDLRLSPSRWQPVVTSFIAATGAGCLALVAIRMTLWHHPVALVWCVAFALSLLWAFAIRSDKILDIVLLDEQHLSLNNEGSLKLVSYRYYLGVYRLQTQVSTVWIWPDQLSQEEFRHLRVWLNSQF
jgi:hypothetical protein